VHHGALAHLLGINALRASEAAAVRIEDCAETLRGHRVLHLVGPRHISPHSLRHAAITNALDAGVPLRDAQDPRPAR
jgi:site-specific recombinase XerC